MNLYLTNTDQNCVDVLDFEPLIDDLIHDSVQDFAQYFKASLIVDRPRGVVASQPGEVAIAAWDSLSKASYVPSMGTILEFDGRVMGRNNHDVLLAEDELFVISSVPVNEPNLPSGLVSRSHPRIPLPGPQEFHFLINTASADQQSFTHLGARNSSADSRDTSHDGVVILGEAIAHPNEKWNAPHHPAKDGSGAWWVCNSGVGDLVNLKTGTIHHVGGFPRGLSWVEHDGVAGFLFTKTALRQDPNQAGFLAWFEPQKSNLQLLKLPDRTAPYTFAIS